MCKSYRIVSIRGRNSLHFSANFRVSVNLSCIRSSLEPRCVSVPCYCYSDASVLLTVQWRSSLVTGLDCKLQNIHNSHYFDITLRKRHKLIGASTITAVGLYVQNILCFYHHRGPFGLKLLLSAY